ncbi:MFS general substrate transporter [Microthyrium microscopicum]|uniref:MFS general substrate transporter n=1 Tax=Microthyrium microscopicum TaxID=703497 RepID=A0A6A6UUM0_9PEZI|nr:MFS general substrate transporter [Microthyrium microscopicum]
MPGDDKSAIAHEMSVASSSPSAGSAPRNVMEPEFRTYKRRWFGLIQLILLNIVVSWDWLTFAAVSSTTAQYLNVTETAVNWLSTGFLFAFVISAPITVYTLHRGPKLAILVSSALILVGNWLRYAGTKQAMYPLVMVGQVLIGLAQPFVLSAPTTYSDLWFTDKGRTTATAFASLANPLGGALGQLIAPSWVSKDPKSIPTMVLYVAIISSVATIPSLFIPARPPTPVSPASSVPKAPLSDTIRQLSHNKSFYLILIPFATYVGFFNATSSLINQILSPYGFTEDEAGIAGGILIIVGILAAIAVSIVNDRVHAYVPIIKVLVPITAVSYLAFLFAPATRTIAAPYAILAILGAASFSLMPTALEYTVEVTFPVGPEGSSVVLWACGQVLGGIFTIIMGELKDPDGTPPSKDYPPGNMQRALIFQAIICCLVAVVPMGLGLKALGLDGEERKRFAMDEGNPVPEPDTLRAQQRRLALR